MASYYAYMPPSDRHENPLESFQLIKDGTAKWAMIFPFLWLIWHRLWMPCMVYLVLMGAIMSLLYMHPNIALSYLSLLLNVYFFLEGNQLRAKKLEREGWGLIDIVNGENEDEAALRFLSHYGNDMSHTIKVIKPASLHQEQKPLFNPSPTTGLFPE